MVRAWRGPATGHVFAEEGLDWLLASRGVLPALRGDAEVRWDLGLNPHAAQVFRVELQENRSFTKWHPATPVAPLSGQDASS